MAEGSEGLGLRTARAQGNVIVTESLSSTPGEMMNENYTIPRLGACYTYWPRALISREACVNGPMDGRGVGVSVSRLPY